jgi:hypothetical protein
MASQNKTFPGLIANRVRSENAITISRGNCINGSGKGAFGGASTWPYLRVEIEVQVGEERILDAVEDDIIKSLERNELLGRRRSTPWQTDIRRQARKANHERTSPRRKH